MMSDERLAEIEQKAEEYRNRIAILLWPNTEVLDLLAEIHRLRRELDRYRDAGAVVESGERYEGEE